MSDLIPGKRYRWTVEGVASSGGRALNLGDGGVVSTSFLSNVGTLELIPDPLPTTPGSVVTLRGALYGRTTRRGEHHWIGLGASGTPVLFSNNDLAGATVLFDAGASE